jgi:hypothetical protein
MAKSRKVKRQRKQEKRRRQRLMREKGQEQKRLQGFKQRLEKDLLQGHKVVVEPRGVAKMSEVLEAFVEPYLALADTEDAYRKLLMLALVAWNASFLTEDEQSEMVDDITSKAMPSATREEREDFRELVSTLVERKRAHFSEYTRRIIDFELTDTGKDYHLSVVSTMQDTPKRS